MSAAGAQLNIHGSTLLVLAAGLIVLAIVCGTAPTAQPAATPAGKRAAAPTGERAPTQEPQVQPTPAPTPALSTTSKPVTPVKAAPSPAPPEAAVIPEADPVQQADIFDFVLPDITVAAGVTVRWTNLDSEGHTATPGTDGIYDRSGWDSQGLGLNRSFSHQFDDEGAFPYTCRFHPWMNATVTVVADQSSAAPASWRGSNQYAEQWPDGEDLMRANS